MISNIINILLPILGIVFVLFVCYLIYDYIYSPIKKVRFNGSNIRELSLTSEEHKKENYNEEYRNNMDRNRRIGMIEKMAKQQNILGNNNYLDVVPRKKENNKICMAVELLGRSNGYLNDNESLLII